MQLPYKIGPSAVHGNGLIAARDIEPGENIGTVIFLEGMQPAITDMGKYVNHSNSPNSHLKLLITEKRYDLFATTQIKNGEEIIANYNETPYFLEKPKPGFV